MTAEGGQGIDWAAESGRNLLLSWHSNSTLAESNCVSIRCKTGVSASSGMRYDCNLWSQKRNRELLAITKAKKSVWSSRQNSTHTVLNPVVAAPTKLWVGTSYCPHLVKVTQQCSTFCDPMNYTVHGILWVGQNTGVGSFSLLQGIFPTQGTSPGLQYCQCILYQLSHKRSPWILEWLADPFSRGSSWLRKQTRVSCTAGRFFTNWAIEKAHIYMGFASYWTLHCLTERQDPAQSDRIQAQIPPTRKPLHGTYKTPPRGGKTLQLSRTMTFQTAERRPPKQQIKQNERQRNMQQLKEHGKKPQDQTMGTRKRKEAVYLQKYSE